jgi:hypothetical protein
MDQTGRGEWQEFDALLRIEQHLRNKGGVACEQA